MITLDRVSKVYRKASCDVHSLSDVSLCIERGEHVAIVGPSGSGKTTLLQIMGTLDAPTAGCVRFLGRDLGRLRDAERTRIRRREIGFVFQHSNLVPSLSAVENVALPSMLDGVSRGIALARAKAHLVTLGLSHRVAHRPNELSGGEMQRVAIARALSIEPRLILCDEPTGRLDSAAGHDVRRLLRQIVTRGDRSLVVVTHDPEMAADADRVIRILDGRIATVEVLRGTHARRVSVA